MRFYKLFGIALTQFFTENRTAQIFAESHAFRRIVRKTENRTQESRCIVTSQQPFANLDKIHVLKYFIEIIQEEMKESHKYTGFY